MTNASAVEPPTRARGIRRPWDPRVWGTLVGAVGATVFVFAYRDSLPGPWPTVTAVAWAVALGAYIVFVFAMPRNFDEIERVGARQGFVYLASVAGMLLLINLGTLLLSNAGEAELRPALIVIAVGLHFIPFAVAFHTPMFLPLGATLAALGTVGLVLGGLVDARLAAALAVTSGVVLLAFMTIDAARAKH